MLGALGLLLVVGLVGIVAAAVREARLVPGVAANEGRRKRALIAGAAALVFACFAVYWGGRWWNVEAADYAADMHRNSELKPTLEGDRLNLRIGDPDVDAPGGWLEVKNSDMLLDHGHLMHLYAIREPEMDAVFHLHPEAAGKRGLAMTLPDMPAGTYKLYGDVVFLNGFPETETAELTVPEGLSKGTLGAEDAEAMPAGLSKGDLGAVYQLPDGYSMVWDKPGDGGSCGVCEDGLDDVCAYASGGVCGYAGDDAGGREYEWCERDGRNGYGRGCEAGGGVSLWVSGGGTVSGVCADEAWRDGGDGRVRRGSGWGEGVVSKE